MENLEWKMDSDCSERDHSGDLCDTLVDGEDFVGGVNIHLHCVGGILAAS